MFNAAIHFFLISCSLLWSYSFPPKVPFKLCSISLSVQLHFPFLLKKKKNTENGSLVCVNWLLLTVWPALECGYSMLPHWRKLIFPFLAVMNSWLGLGIVITTQSSSMLGFLRLELIQDMCILLQSFWILIFICCFWKMLSGKSGFLLLPRNFCLLFHIVTWALRERVWCRHPVYGWGLQSLSFSEYCPVVSLFANYYPRKESSLMMFEW